MAERRMISRRVVESGKFLMLPASTRLLYYDLCVRADDDGVVEAVPVIRSTGAVEGDLTTLADKGYIEILDYEYYIVFIKEWREHNKIRADRKIDSRYKDLLVKVVPEANLLEARKRADTKKKTGEKEWTSNGQIKDGIGEDRIGEDRIGEDRIGKDSLVEDRIEKTFELSQSLLECLNKTNFTLTEETEKTIEQLVKEYSEVELKTALSIAYKKKKHNLNYVKAILVNRKAEGKNKNIKNFEATDDYYREAYEDLNNLMFEHMDEDIL